MTYSLEHTIPWGECDPFGLVYFPHMLAWFNDVEHEWFRSLGYPIDGMIRDDRTTFVMGEIGFRFVGPAAYGDRVTARIELAEMRERTVHWRCTAVLTGSGAPVTVGTATRIYAHINDDGSLASRPIPGEMRAILTAAGARAASGGAVDARPGR